MEPATILSFLTNLIKPRDYLFFGIPSTGLFVAESINDDIIPYMTIGASAIVAGVIGVIINKTAVQLYYDNRNKAFTLKASENYVKYLDELLSNQAMLTSHRKVVEGLKLSLESAITIYNKKIMTYEELKKKFDSLKEIDFDF